MSLYVAGAVFGEVAVSLFVAGAVFGELSSDSRSIQNAFRKWEGEARRTGGLRLTRSWSDHARIMLGIFSNRPSKGNYVSDGFCHISNLHFFVAGAAFGEVHMMLESHFSWQAQYLVKFS